MTTISRPIMDPLMDIRTYISYFDIDDGGDAWSNAHPKAAMKAIGILSARVRALGHALVGLTSDNVQTRIARLLLHFATVSTGIRCCADSNNNDELCVNVRLTHQNIADLIGVTRQTVTTTLAQFRKRGTVRMINQHIHIVRPNHLRRLLELDAAKVRS